jgi:copper chaperone CopZ
MRTILFTLTMMIALTGNAYAETIKATVNGMVCAFCAAGIEKTFKAQKEVGTVKVDLDQKLVTIQTKKDKTISDEKITKVINDAGYSVADIVRDEK